MHKISIILVCLISILLCDINHAVELKKEDKINHISLSLKESLINEFLKGILPIKDKGEAMLLKYHWELIEPRLDIEKDTALFYSDVKISVGPYDTIKKIEGWVSVNYDKDINKIILKIEEAKVILDVNILGTKIVLSELDIASYFSTPFKLNGPEPIASNIEYKLPNGEIRKVSCKTSSSELFLVKDAIQVSTSLDFKKIID